VKCFYLVGYHGCGKTTQANLLEKAFPQYNYIGGKAGLDAVPSVAALAKEVRESKADMVIHGCIFQTEPTIMRLSRMTQLIVIVLHSTPNNVKARTLKRGAADYNPLAFSLRGFLSFSPVSGMKAQHATVVTKLVDDRLIVGVVLNVTPLLPYCLVMMALLTQALEHVVLECGLAQFAPRE